METCNAIIRNEPLPSMARVRQNFCADKVEDPVKETWRQLDREEIRASIRPGMSIALTAGSRNAANMTVILRETASFLKELGAHPFVVPAMGSHGGSTAEGQEKVLRSLGITEETVGAPIRSSMKVTQIASLEDGRPVYIDKYAAEADGIVVINRIKAHTAIVSNYESGILKMMAIGLGKQYGASVVHNDGMARTGMNVEMFGKTILANSKVIFAVAAIENAYHETYGIVSMTRDEILVREPECLKLAKSLMPRIYFEHLDLLIIDEIGKNISGPGMDPNVSFTFYEGNPRNLERRRARRIVVLDLTPESHGSALGVGMADFTTLKLVKKFDRNATYSNILTNKTVEHSKIPPYFDTSELAVKAGLHTIFGADRENLRVVRIRNTLTLREIEISAALMEEANNNPDVEILSELAPMEFDSDGEFITKL